MRILTSLFIAALSLPALADWQLVNDASKLEFISTKKAAIAEVHSFKKLSGSVSETGEINFVIDLTSVETNIPIRNERMNKFLFETEQFATATFTSKIDINVLTGLAAGEEKSLSLAGQLSLHGVEQTVKTEVLVVKKAGGEVLVVNTSPIIVNAGDYNLIDGVNKLKELAKLPSISLAVPVSFQLTFK